MSALLSSTTTENADVVRHALDFVREHVQAVTDVLQDTTSTPTLSSLRLLRVWAGIFYALAPHLHHPHAPVELQRHAGHFRELLLNLLHKYAQYPEAAGGAAAALSQDEPWATPHADGDRGTEALRLRQALMGYFRRAMVGEGEQALIFSPHLHEDCSRPPTKHVGSLSLLALYVYHSGQCLTQLAHSRAALEVQLQRATHGEMLPGEVAKLLDSAGFSVNPNPTDKLRIVVAFLVRKLRAATEAHTAHQRVVENALLVLWRHLQVYCQQPQLKERLYRAASMSDRVGLLALVQRMAGTEDSVLFDILRRLRGALER